MSENNPYSSPATFGKSIDSYNPSNDSFVKQVPIVGILMIVGGALELLMGLFYVGMGLFVGYVMVMAEAQSQTQNDPATVEEIRMVSQFALWIYGTIGASGVIGGALRLAGGVQVVRFRTYNMGLIGNFGGLISAATCYCSPFTVGVSVYGLIVLFQGSVKAEFARRSS